MKSRISPKVEIRTSEINKKGMFAKELIHKGEIVYVKGGHVITKNELLVHQLLIAICLFQMIIL